MNADAEIPIDPIADREGEVPVCPQCFQPHHTLQHYCENCGQVVGRFTPYIPFVNIRFNYSCIDRMWNRLWLPKHESQIRRAVYLVILVFCILLVPNAWILIFGIPFWRSYSKYRRTPGLCVQCGYDLRSGHDRCPECGLPAVIQSD